MDEKQWDYEGHIEYLTQRVSELNQTIFRLENEKIEWTKEKARLKDTIKRRNASIKELSDRLNEFCPVEPIDPKELVQTKLNPADKDWLNKNGIFWG